MISRESVDGIRFGHTMSLTMGEMASDAGNEWDVRVSILK